MALLFVLSASGCAKTFKLTNEEETLIAEYSSHILVKHSKQSSSLLLSRDDLEKAIAKKEEQDRLVEQKRAERNAASSAAGRGSSAADGSEANKGNSGSSASSAEAQAATNVSMTDAIGVGGVEFNYKGYEVMDYIQGAAFSVNASPGKQLVVMEFTATNTTDEAKVCDLKTAKTRFRGYFNGKTVNALATAFLPNDIASFDKNTKIDAKKSMDCVLIFDVPKDLASELNDVRLSVIKDGAAGAAGVTI